MPGHRRVVVASLAAATAGTVAIALSVFGSGGGHALSLDASAARHIASRSAGTGAGGTSADPDLVGTPQQASVPGTASSSSSASAAASSSAASAAGDAPSASFAAAQTAASTITGPPLKVPAMICGNKRQLTGPATRPAGAVKVPAGNNASFNFRRANTTYWFAPGVHTLGNGEFNNIDPGNGATFIGGPGAILDGMHKQDSAFDDTSTHIKIQYLTIRNFGTWGGGQQQGVVNKDSGSYWTIGHSSIIGNAGAGVMLGNNNVLAYNCIRANQQYGFNAYSNNGTIHNLVLDHNEIAGNNTWNYEVKENGCGCSGGGKFWNVINAIVTNNWIVNNKSVGLWADTNNAGFQFVGNYFQGNQDNALMYEISYNALIQYNMFWKNGISGGPSSTGFPMSAVYISESGSDPRVHTKYGTQFLVANNEFLDNWGGIILWENANRFCASPDNSSTGYCTMVDPKATIRTCSNPAVIKGQPYHADCRWKVQNFLVRNNLFSFKPADIGKACTRASNCGFNGVFSEYGSDPSWSPYKGDLVPNNIAYAQNNHFSANTYVGPWCFMGWQLGTSVGWNLWRGARSTANIGNSNQTFGQDAKSTHTGSTWACR